VLVGWGVGGVVADALAAPARRVVLLDAPAPGAVNTEPSEAQRLRSFAMYIGARKGLTVRPDELTLDRIREAAIAVGALRGDTAPAAVERCFEEHSARVLRDHRLTASHAPSGTPLTVVKAADSVIPDSPALGWDRFGPVERLGSGGNHYSMLTDTSAAAHLAMLLRRWLAPAFSSAA
jgi:thioesterase domain-containing protein